MHGKTFKALKLGDVVTIWDDSSPFYGKVGTVVETDLKHETIGIYCGEFKTWVARKRVAMGDNSLARYPEK